MLEAILPASVDRVRLPLLHVAPALRDRVLARLDAAHDRHLGLVIRDLHVLELGEDLPVDRADQGTLLESWHAEMLQLWLELRRLLLQLLLESSVVYLALELGLHLEAGLSDLLAHVGVGTRLELGVHFLAYIVSLLELEHCCLVLGLMQLQLLLQALLLLGLLHLAGL